MNFTKLCYQLARLIILVVNPNVGEFKNRYEISSTARFLLLATMSFLSITLSAFTTFLPILARKKLKTLW